MRVVSAVSNAPLSTTWLPTVDGLSTGFVWCPDEWEPDTCQMVEEGGWGLDGDPGSAHNRALECQYRNGEMTESMRTELWRIVAATKPHRLSQAPSHKPASTTPRSPTDRGATSGQRRQALADRGRERQSQRTEDIPLKENTPLSGRAHPLSAGLDQSLPLSVDQSPPLSAALDAETEHMVLLARPCTADDVSAGIFALSRRLRSRATPNQGPEDFARVLQRWVQVATAKVPSLATKPLQGLMDAFIKGWQQVKQPLGNKLARIMTEVRSGSLPREADRYGDHQTQLLIGLCEALQIRAGDEPFFLTCRNAGEMIGLGRQAANELLQMLCREGILRRVEKGRLGRASRYHYMPLMKTMDIPDTMEEVTQ